MEVSNEFNAKTDLDALLARNNPVFIAFTKRLQEAGHLAPYLSEELPVSVSTSKLVHLEGFRVLSGFCRDKDVAIKMNSHFFKDGPYTTLSVDFSRPFSASEIYDSGFGTRNFDAVRTGLRKTLLQKLLRL